MKRKELSLKYVYQHGATLTVRPGNPGSNNQALLKLEGDGNCLAIELSENEVGNLATWCLQNTTIQKGTNIMVLEIDKTKEAKLLELESAALESVIQAIKHGGDMDDSEKTAIKALNVVVKNRQTITARQALEFSMVSALANPEELERYITATTPFKPKELKTGQNNANQR